MSSGHSLPPRRSLPTLLDDDPGALRMRCRGVLTQLRGVETGRVCSFESDWATLGRSGDALVSFEDGSLSRAHARIAMLEGSYVIEDLGSSNGTFVNDDRIDRRALYDGDLVRLGRTVTLRFQRVDHAEEAALRKVYESSVHDGLTGVWNRRHFEERLVSELSFALRHDTPLVLVIFDLDHFKRVNDTYGHPAGDAVLRETAAAVNTALRREDVLGRYGGEEFVVAARGIPLPHGALLGERVRQAVMAKPVRFEHHSIPCTASVGVASLDCCGEDKSLARLLAVADQRLYAAKQGGRNRVVSS